MSVRNTSGLQDVVAHAWWLHVTATFGLTYVEHDDNEVTILWDTPDGSYALGWPKRGGTTCGSERGVITSVEEKSADSTGGGGFGTSWDPNLLAIVEAAIVTASVVILRKPVLGVLGALVVDWINECNRHDLFGNSRLDANMEFVIDTPLVPGGKVLSCCVSKLDVECHSEAAGK